MSTALALLWRFRWPVLLTAALGLALWQRDVANGLRKDISDHALEDERSAIRAQEAAKQAEAYGRERERIHVDEMAAISAQHEQEKLHALAEKDAVIAGLRDGTYRLRTRLAAAAATSGLAAQVGASASGGDGAAQNGLRIEDAGFFVRESERADDVVRQLTACQAVIQSDRGLQKQ